MERQIYLPRKSIFSIIYSEYVNFLICIKHMKQGCSVWMSSTKIHHKQQSSAKNTELCTKIHICMDFLGSVLPYLYLLFIYTKQTLETVTIIADRAEWMYLHSALVCPAVCIQECTLLLHLPHTCEFSRSHKCDWFCYKIFLLCLCGYWLC